MRSSVEDVAHQTLERFLPPAVEADLPLELQDELDAMGQLSDNALWQIAESVMNPDKVALYDVMLERLQTNQLTAEGRVLLDRLRTESEALTLRKAHAYALLQSRGHNLPSLDDLNALQ
ncbi:MAG: hypothetical protein GY803_17695 [Chloroflexi bacterium]|nr:hypothetical protein [Chloroflexota bacterium]